MIRSAQIHYQYEKEGSSAFRISCLLNHHQPQTVIERKNGSITSSCKSCGKKIVFGANRRWQAPRDTADQLVWWRLCFLDRHAPVNHRVNWDGTHFVGKCKHCRRPIRRHAHKLWRTR